MGIQEVIHRYPTLLPPYSAVIVHGEEALNKSHSRLTHLSEMNKKAEGPSKHEWDRVKENVEIHSHHTPCYCCHLVKLSLGRRHHGEIRTGPEVIASTFDCCSGLKKNAPLPRLTVIREWQLEI